MSDPKNAQFYEALQNTLLSQGTDISQYIEVDEETKENQDKLAELKKQREALKMSQEISKEQQEYEQLFTGSLGAFGSEEEVTEETQEARESLSKDRLSSLQNLQKQKIDAPKRTSQQDKNKDIDKKIADYYRRKQEMIDKFNKEQYADVQEDVVKLSDYEQKQSDYEAVFNGSIYTNSNMQSPEENARLEESIAEDEQVENVENIEENETIQENQQIEDYENAELLSEENNTKPVMEFEDYEEEVNYRKSPTFKFPTNSEFDDIDSEYALIRRGGQTDKTIINYEDSEFSTPQENEEVEKIKTSDSNENVTEETIDNEQAVEKVESEEEIVEEVTQEKDEESHYDGDEVEEQSEESTQEDIEEKISAETSVFNEEVVYEEDTTLENEESAETTEQEESSEVEESTQILEDDETVELEQVEENENSTEEENVTTDSSTFFTVSDDEEVEKDNEYENTLVNEYSEENEENKYDLNNGDISDYIIASNSEEIESEENSQLEDTESQEEIENQSEENEEIQLEEVEDQESLSQDVEEESEISPEVEEIEEDTLTEEVEESSESAETTEQEENSEVQESTPVLEDDETLAQEEVEETPNISASEINEKLLDASEEDEVTETQMENIEEAVEENTPVMYTEVDDDDDDNSLVIDGDKFVSELSLFDESEETSEEEKVEETTQEKVEEENSISKEEFYNEMARLQENLLNELKGQKVEKNSYDYFKEEEVEEDEEIEEYIEESSEDSRESTLAEEIINNWKAREEKENSEEIEEISTKTEEEIAEEKRLEEEKAKKEEIEGLIANEVASGENLLQVDKPLDDVDLKYQEDSEKEKEAVKDDYFYLSQEHNEKETVNDDEYVKIYNEEITGIYEVGDINLNKDIMNAVPYSRVETEEEIRMKKEKEIELIYTLFGMEEKKVNNKKEDMKILYVAGECQPFIATGGLADVAGSLPKAIAEKGGVDIRVILPLYGNIKNEYRDKFEYIGNFTVHLSWRQEYCGLFRYYSDGVTYYFIDNERYFKREKTYGYYDDGERFAYFSKAIVECLPHINFFPDIIHCNDWQSALVSTYIKTGNWSDFRYYKIKHIYTIHNVEYQGVYGMENLKDLFGIDPRFKLDMDYNGDINLTKAAIQFSDKFTTVSNSYCDNLKQPYCSRGLHHVIIRNEYKLSGIVNGLDYDFYNPATDKVLYKNYSVETIQDKVMNKKIWQDELGLPVDGETPMIAIVSRLVAHKGLDLIIKMIENVLQKDVQLVVVGTGDQKFVDYFKYLEGKYPTKVRAMVDKYSNELARKAYGASDIFLMPSKVEPCGLSQMIASRYGSIPIVREVGGLKDTIKDFGCPEGGNGYTFTSYNPSDLEYQVNRAIAEYKDKDSWKEKMKVCMTTDFTWATSADKYMELYNSLMK